MTPTTTSTGSSFNGMLDRRPAAIALVESVDDVVAALTLARAEGLQIARAWRRP